MDERAYNYSLIKQEHRVLPINNSGDIRVVVAYPNRYAVGMSNLGFHSVYRLFNNERRFLVERAFMPTYQSQIKKTFESHTSLSSVDILAVSVSFESDYENVVSLIGAAGLDLDSCVGVEASVTKRSLEHISRPFIIGGGAALTINPEPVAHLFDAIVIGEAEEIVPEISKVLTVWHDTKSSFYELLQQLAYIDGVYIPSLFDVTYSSAGGIETIDFAGNYVKTPKRQIFHDLGKCPAYSTIVTSETELSSMMLIETGRGCATGCRFCVASKMYQPVRNQSYEIINKIIKESLNISESIGLVGTSVSRHPDIQRIVRDVTDAGMQCGLSSIMTPCVTQDFANVVAKSGVLTIALAPEAATEELRFRIGKRVTNETIFEAVKNLVSNGICSIKLYFMIGLPGEEPRDVIAICDFAKEVLAVGRRIGSLRKLHLSVNPFIPKPWTPFQWDSMIDIRNMRERFNVVRDSVRKLNGVSVKFESPRECYVQAALAKGDRRLCDVLIKLHRDAKSLLDCVSTGHIQLLPHVPSLHSYVYEPCSLETKLAWEIIDMGISREKLETEYRISRVAE